MISGLPLLLLFDYPFSAKRALGERARRLIKLYVKGRQHIFLIISE